MSNNYQLKKARAWMQLLPQPGMKWNSRTSLIVVLTLVIHCSSIWAAMSCSSPDNEFLSSSLTELTEHGSYERNFTTSELSIGENSRAGWDIIKDAPVKQQHSHCDYVLSLSNGAQSSDVSQLSMGKTELVDQRYFEQSSSKQHDLCQSFANKNGAANLGRYFIDEFYLDVTYEVYFNISMVEPYRDEDANLSEPVAFSLDNPSELALWQYRKQW